MVVIAGFYCTKVTNHWNAEILRVTDNINERERDEGRGREGGKEE